jgi:hypothetical protein
MSDGAGRNLGVIMCEERLRVFKDMENILKSTGGIVLGPKLLIPQVQTPQLTENFCILTLYYA